MGLAQRQLHVTLRYIYMPFGRSYSSFDLSGWDTSRCMYRGRPVLGGMPCNNSSDQNESASVGLGYDEQWSYSILL